MYDLQVPKSSFTLEYTTFREILRELRIDKQLTQDQLSETMGMPQSFVSKYETGERRLDIVETRAVCIALGTNLSAFVRRFEARLAEADHGGKS